MFASALRAKMTICGGCWCHGDGAWIYTKRLRLTVSDRSVIQANGKRTCERGARSMAEPINIDIFFPVPVRYPAYDTFS